MNIRNTPNTEDSDSIFMTYLSTAAIKSAQITYPFPLFQGIWKYLQRYDMALRPRYRTDSIP